MNIFLQWAGSLIFAAAVSAVVLMLTPKGVNENIMKMAVGAFFICCAALPLIDSLPDISSELAGSFEQGIDYTSDLGNTVESQVITETKLILSQSAKDIFRSLQCSNANAQFELSVDEKNRVTIESVSITISEADAQKVQEICDAFLSSYGKSPQINIK